MICIYARISSTVYVSYYTYNMHIYFGNKNYIILSLLLLSLL